MFTKGRKISKEIGLRLQEVRRQAGLSVREMAARLGVTRVGYAKNEGGLYNPNLDTLRHLSQDFDTSIDWLLLNKGPRYNKEKFERENELEKTVEELTRDREVLRNETADLKREVQELKNRLEEIAQAKAAAIEMIPEVREFLDHMKQDPIFYHRSMLNFQEFKLQKKIPLETGKAPSPEIQV